MQEPVFLRVLELIQQYDPQTVILHKDGEPLMCPNFKDYFRRIVEVTGNKIDLYTNGILLTPDIIKHMSVVNNGNKIWILVSFHRHGYTKSGEIVYYDMEESERNLRACVELNEPNIEFIVTTHKTDLADDKGSHEFYVKWVNVSIQHPNLKAVHVNACINHWAGRVTQQKEMAHFYACPYADSMHFFVGITGNVIPCCVDMEEEIVFGNILSDPIEEIMSKREVFYKNITRKEAEHQLCQRCLE